VVNVKNITGINFFYLRPIAVAVVIVTVTVTIFVKQHIGRITICSYSVILFLNDLNRTRLSWHITAEVNIYYM